MNKGLAALVISFSSIAFAQDANVPKPSAVADYVKKDGFKSGLRHDTYWLAREKTQGSISTGYVAVLDEKYIDKNAGKKKRAAKKMLYACEEMKMGNDEIISTCITDLGLVGSVGSCFVARLPVSESLDSVMARDFDPEYLFGSMTERDIKGDPDAKQYCDMAYERIRTGMTPAEVPPEGLAPEK